MNLSEYSSFDGVGLARLVRNSEVSAEALTRLAATAAERLNPVLHAIVDVYSDRVATIDSDANLQGSFAGVPFLLKDIGAFEKDRPQCSGSRLGEGYVATRNSYLTQAFKSAGFNIFGRTNLPEFAQAATSENRHYGDARNPWHTARSPGGSSGGAAAAVAAGIVPIAHGTDTGGSIRIPAACCGLVGLKPSRGRVSKGPQLDETLYGGLNTEFVLTRSVRDAAAVLDCVAGRRAGDPFALPRPDVSFAAVSRESPRSLRIAVQTESPFAGVASDVAQATEDIARVLERAGHTIVTASPQVDGNDWAAAERTIWLQSTAWEVKRLSAATGNAIGAETLEPLSLGAYELSKNLSANEWFEAKARCNAISRAVGTFFEEFDILITPTIARTAPKLGEIAGSDTADYDVFLQRVGRFSPFTSLFNITGQPAMSLPLATSEEGLPIGVQLVGRYAEEHLLLQLATLLERTVLWANSRPPVHAAGAARLEAARAGR